MEKAKRSLWLKYSYDFKNTAKKAMGRVLEVRGLIHGMELTTCMSILYIFTMWGFHHELITLRKLGEITPKS